MHIERSFLVINLTKLICHISSFHRLPKWQIMPNFRKRVISCLLCLPWFSSPRDWVYFLSGECANLLSNRATVPDRLYESFSLGIYTKYLVRGLKKVRE